MMLRITFGRNREVVELTEEVRGLRRQVEELKVLRDVELESLSHQKTINDLRSKVNNLQIDKSKLDEQNAREKRELEHMIGLERKRQVHEVEAAKRDATLTVREEALAGERAVFDEQMRFQKAHFDTQVDYLKDLMGQILMRLPTVEVTAKR